MNSPLGFIIAGTAIVVCFHWICVGASVSSGVVNITVTNTSDCVCNPVGSLNTTCDNTTADCLCRNGYEGPNCTDCQDGYYHHSNRSAECIPCQCDETGSLNNSCDRYATCSCKPGVGGKQCNQCLSGHYELSATGCKQCTCDKVASVCLDQSKFRSSSHPSMCHYCLLNETWVNQCTKPTCLPSEYLTPDSVCTPCQCGQSQGTVHGTRQCDLMTGKCPECEGESCSKGGNSQYQVYIIVSGAAAGVVVIVLAILLTVYCRRRCRRQANRPRLPLWTIELRQDEDRDEFDATQELAFDDLDVMYLDDSYLMEPTPEYFNESTDNLNGRAGYHTLSSG
ncbi:laminin subunit alpha-1-like [Patiria miniata]|uniref:Laminin EGF-like domain-containing protein n=1 Tax=Patiria miniata TaxID=46514 RepID=A0A913Z1H9_PATMI|nr:laminin subunit alpha-1-like [Patiria miniata]